jgi:hypothetical protein
VADDRTYLTPEESSDVLKDLGLPTALSTLKKLRCVGGGPTFVKFGRFARYTRPWLREYAESRLSAPLRSTSEASPQKKTRTQGNACAKPMNGAETGTPDRAPRSPSACAREPTQQTAPGPSTKKGRRSGADLER